jgi:cytoskeletal protein CcmA (bactofilin family)
MINSITGLFGKKETPKATVISKGTTITGKLETTDLLFVSGNIFSDKITCTQIVIENTGDIRSDIFADILHVYGTITGNIQANEVYIYEGATVHGDITYTEKISISTLNGSDTIINGNIKYMNIIPENNSAKVRVALAPKERSTTVPAV